MAQAAIVFESNTSPEFKGIKTASSLRRRLQVKVKYQP